MAKLKYIDKQGQVSVRLKLSSSERINNNEVMFFSRDFSRGFMRPIPEDSSKILFTGARGIALSKFLKRNINKDHFYMMIAQLLEAYKAVMHYKLHPAKVVLDLDFIIINENTGELYLIYQPVLNSPALNKGFMTCFGQIASMAKFGDPNDKASVNNFMGYASSLPSFSVNDLEGFIMSASPVTYTIVPRQNYTNAPAPQSSPAQPVPLAGAAQPPMNNMGGMPMRQPDLSQNFMQSVPQNNMGGMNPGAAPQRPAQSVSFMNNMETTYADEDMMAPLSAPTPEPPKANESVQRATFSRPDKEAPEFADDKPPVKNAYGQTPKKNAQNGLSVPNALRPAGDLFDDLMDDEPPKEEAPKQEPAKKEEPQPAKAEEPKAEPVKEETTEEPKAEKPKEDEYRASFAAPEPAKAEEPKAEPVKEEAPEAPKAEEPKPEPVKEEAPEAAKAEKVKPEPVKEEVPEAPKAEEPKPEPVKEEAPEAPKAEEIKPEPVKEEAPAAPKAEEVKPEKKRIHKVMVKPVKVKAVPKKSADSDDDEPPTTVVQGYVQPAEKAEKPVSKPGVDAAPAGPPPIPFTPKRTEPVPPPDYNLADQFSADDEGTVVLSDYKPNEPDAPPAKLLRRSTNETVLISKNVFTIGKERAKVDYCVTNNKTVSRMHATVYRRGNVYYIVDSNSTNGTFVNNSRIPAQTEVKLNNGDLLRLSNEEFDFKED